jgi:EAL and modified HD-GYP domain-containing signal transduction protein
MLRHARPATDVLVARQPVYDPNLRVVAYELLVQRSDGSSAAEEADASHTISEIGLSLVMGHPAYIPVTRGFLLEGYATALAPGRVVLAVGPDLQLDRAARDALEELVAGGYRLALIDYEHGTAFDALLPLAHVVGLNVAGLDRATLRAEMARLRPLGVKLLARGVEQHEELELCTGLGFDLLQGYFICRPRVVSERGLEVNAANRVRLISRLHDNDVDFDELQQIISRDVALSYNLLRFINSAFFALPRRVDSIRDALVLLGAINVRKWASLMALAASDDKPRELVVTGLVRARMCELLAGAYHHRDGDGAFTTGLFSVVDALTDRSLVEVLAALPLSREIIQALLNYEGQKGRLLRATVAYERGNFAELGDLPPIRTPLSELYSEAVAWATEASGGLPLAEPVPQAPEPAEELI